MDRHGPWFKFWCEWIDDPKVQRLSEVDQRRHAAILCLRCAGEPFDVDNWAFRIRVSPDELRASLKRLSDLGLVAADGSVPAWDRRQGKSGAQRCREWRERHSDVTVTSQKRHGDGSEADPDSEAEAETDKNPLPPSGVSPVGEAQVPVVQNATPVKKPKASYTAAEQTAIDVSKAQWRNIHKLIGQSPRIGGAAEAGIVRYLKRPDGGWEKLRAALKCLVEHPAEAKAKYDFSQESNRPWFTLEWFVRMESSKGLPVNRPAEVLDGGWATPYTMPEEQACPKCHCLPCGCNGPIQD